MKAEFIISQDGASFDDVISGHTLDFNSEQQTAMAFNFSKADKAKYAK